MVSRVTRLITSLSRIQSSHAGESFRPKLSQTAAQSFTHNSGTLQVPPKLSHSRVCVPQLDKGGKIDYLCIF